MNRVGGGEPVWYHTRRPFGGPVTHPITRLMATTTHTWKFFRAGGFDQVKLQTGADLLNLDQLDQKLWVALACPTTGIEFDPKTSALIDTDKDGRIRARELIAAIKWAGSMLRNADELVKGVDGVALSAINDAAPEGQQVLGSARAILANLGKKESAVFTVADATAAASSFANTVFNGDGVIIPESASDAAVQAVIREAIASVGSVTDRSGKPGIDTAKLDAFFAELAALDGWVKVSEADSGTILPAGAGTAAASAAIRAVKAKVDDFFGRCRLAAFDARTAPLLNRKEEEYVAIATKDLSISAQEISGFPLAHVAAGRALPLTTGINPAHAAAVAAFVAAAVKPLLGHRDELTEADWAALQAKVAPYDAWLASKAGAAVQTLGIARVREILGGNARQAVADLIARDKTLEAEAAGVASVEKLARFHRDLILLATNFVNFKDLYDGGQPAIFQAGTLYLDQRSCTLCIPVEDAGKHAAMAGLAGAYLAYVDCVRKGTGEKRGIVAIFSQGDDDNLMVGRNGIFYDRKGVDFDATITKIVANPISLRQAFWMPYKKLVRMIEEQVAKRAAAADADATTKLANAAATAANADKIKPEEKKVDVGTVAALGVAFGAIGGFFAAVAAFAADISKGGPFAIVAAILGVVALISGPSLILAYIKLRKRNLGPILDANGWAVNAKAKINVPFGTSLTEIATLPPGATRDLVDPFAEKKNPWPKYVVLLLVAYLGYKFLWNGGYVNEWTGGRFGIAKAAPAQKANPVAGSTNGPAATDPAAK